LVGSTTGGSVASGTVGGVVAVAHAASTWLRIISRVIRTKLHFFIIFILLYEIYWREFLSPLVKLDWTTSFERTQIIL
jgi:hypothetical protein